MEYLHYDRDVHGGRSMSAPKSPVNAVFRNDIHDHLIECIWHDSKRTGRIENEKSTASGEKGKDEIMKQVTTLQADYQYHHQWENGDRCGYTYYHTDGTMNKIDVALFDYHFTSFYLQLARYCCIQVCVYVICSPFFVYSCL